ncbi:laminin-binding surface protein [Fictibacillus macauensis ZFHKF-1]|uniref:Laminin-binding surface protein n=1 Tax=Fictibacillus macauensis ZFHKF-1 TaxID=1196324 RepID=I8AL29_9BACL|nr:zinc ABC transporter substrate-binding protein [Fictibacillus macauensis]EIT86309.1 laminin-binding surface protein [Fictibacillus macauensis ZFHKF-1]
MKFRCIAIVSLIFLFVASGCAPHTEQKTKDPLDVTTTLYPLQFFSEQIGGRYVHVRNVVPPGSDAHSFEPTTQDMVSIADSNVFIYNGTGVEGFANKVTDIVKDEGVMTVKAATGIPLARLSHAQDEEEEHAGHQEHDEHDDGDIDPHVWIDPLYAIDLAKNIEQSFSKLRPQHKAYFQKNFFTLKKELLRIHQSFLSVTKHKKNKEMIVSHAAYGYWEKRYGIRQVAVTGISPSQEPSQKQLQALISHVKRTHTSYILLEKTASDKIARIVEQEAGAKTLTLRNLETLTPQEEKAGETYLSLMKQNVNVLQKVLK